MFLKMQWFLAPRNKRTGRCHLKTLQLQRGLVQRPSARRCRVGNQGAHENGQKIRLVRFCKSFCKRTELEIILRKKIKKIPAQLHVLTHHHKRNTPHVSRAAGVMITWQSGCVWSRCKAFIMLN